MKNIINKLNQLKKEGIPVTFTATLKSGVLSVKLFISGEEVFESLLETDINADIEKTLARFDKLFNEWYDRNIGKRGELNGRNHQGT